MNKFLDFNNGSSLLLEHKINIEEVINPDLGVHNFKQSS
jgi:hypothetical protein